MAAGHTAVFCNAAPGCRSVWYRPRHESPGHEQCQHRTSTPHHRWPASPSRIPDAAGQRLSLAARMPGLRHRVPLRRWLRLAGRFLCAERPPAGHGADQSFAGQGAQHTRDRGLRDLVVLSQCRRRGECLVHRPLAGRDPPPQVGGHGLRWALWSAWHTLIIPSGAHSARPARSASLESAKSSALLCSQGLLTDTAAPDGA